MALYHSITIFSVVLIAVFAHGGGRHGGRGGGPPFLRNLTQDQRQSFFQIIKNENSTKAQIQTQLNTWAANISSDFAQMFQNMTTQWMQKKQAMQQREAQKLANDTAAMQVFQQIEAVQNDTSITRAQECEQIRSILNSTTQQIRRELHWFAKCGRRGHGGRGGEHGGFGRGRNGGFGGNQSGFGERFGGQQGGFGGQQGGFGDQEGGFGGNMGFGGNQGYGNGMDQPDQMTMDSN